MLTNQRNEEPDPALHLKPRMRKEAAQSPASSNTNSLYDERASVGKSALMKEMFGLGI
jgi:hypothetical protein